MEYCISLTFRFIKKTFSFSKDAIQKHVYLGLASATNAVEGFTTKELLPGVGCASAHSECPKGNVRLHELCKACTLFSRRTVALGWLDGSHPHSDWPPRKRYRLCTVAHLRRLNGRCHLCTALYYFVSRAAAENADTSWVYLEIGNFPEPWKHDSIRIDASLTSSVMDVGSFNLYLLAGM